jgi:hypothetical protein
LLPKFSWFSKKFLLVLFATDRGSGNGDGEREKKQEARRDGVGDRSSKAPGLFVCGEGIDLSGKRE